MDIKTCPFCASDKVELVPSKCNWWSVRCWGCGAFGVLQDSPKAAIEWWNRRPSEQSLRKLCRRKLLEVLSR